MDPASVREAASDVWDAVNGNDKLKLGAAAAGAVAATGPAAGAFGGVAAALGAVGGTPAVMAAGASVSAVATDIVSKGARLASGDGLRGEDDSLDRSRHFGRATRRQETKVWGAGVGLLAGIPAAGIATAATGPLGAGVTVGVAATGVAAGYAASDALGATAETVRRYRDPGSTADTPRADLARAAESVSKQLSGEETGREAGEADARETATDEASTMAQDTESAGDEETLVDVEDTKLDAIEREDRGTARRAPDPDTAAETTGQERSR